MQRVLLFAVLAACSPARPEPRAIDVPPLVIGHGDGGAGASEGLRFRHPPASVGARWRVALRATSHADDTGAETVYESMFDVEVLAVAGPAPSRVRVHVERNENVFRGVSAPTAVHGRDYVVDVREPHVRDAGGSAVPSNEAERVLWWFPDLGTRGRLDETLPDEGMRVGEARDELAAAILRILHPTAWKLDDGKATLARADATDAVFDVSIATTSALGMKMNLTGTAKVRLADATLAELAMQGRYEMGADKGTFEVTRSVTPISAGPAPSSGR